MNFKKILLGALTGITLFFGISATVWADAPKDNCAPTNEEIASYQEDGSFEERLHYVNALQNDRVSPSLIQNAAARESGISTFSSSVPSDWECMPVTGNIKAFAVRVGFSDHPLDDSILYSEAQLTAMLNDESGSSSAAFPYESLYGYYARSSYQQLALKGDVYEYTASKTRQEYDGQEGEEALLREVLEGLDEAVDYTQYDADGNGCLDAIYLNFAGESSGWGTTWWSHKNTFMQSDFLVDGLTPQGFVFLRTEENGTPTLIHETGHLLGLPDYYSYQNQAYENGLASFDMMNDNQGDQNGFSKWLLGWLGEEDILQISKNNVDTPIALTPLCSDLLDGSKKIAVISPEAKGIFSEYYLVQYETGINNQTAIMQGRYADGFRIFHVNAVLNEEGTNFRHANVSLAEPKLIELVNPIQDGMEHTTYAKGDSLTPDTTPSSAFWGSPIMGYTGIHLTDFLTGASPSFHARFAEKTPATGEYILTPAPGTDTGRISNAAQMEFVSDTPLYQSTGIEQLRPYLEADGKQYPLTVDIQNLYQVKLSYPDIDVALEPDTAYTLVLPENLFQIDQDVLSKEQRIPVKSDHFPKFQYVHNYESANSSSDLCAFGPDKVGYFSLGNGSFDTESIVDLIIYDTVGEPQILPLTLPAPPQGWVEGITQIAAVSCYDDTAALALTLNGKSTVLYKIAGDGTLISGPFLIPSNISLFPYGHGVKGVITESSAAGAPGEEVPQSASFYTIDFEHEPVLKEYPYNREDLFLAIDETNYAHVNFYNKEGTQEVALFNNQDELVRTIDLSKEDSLSYPRAIIRQETILSY